MTTKVTVTESALRQLINDLLEARVDYPAVVTEPPTVITNPTVDPEQRMRSITPDVPVNPMFTPRDKVEFQAGVKNLVRNLPDDDMPELFDAVKDAIDDEQIRKEKEDRQEARDMEKTDYMEAIRAQVRKMIAEARPKARHVEPDEMDPADVAADEEEHEEKARRKHEMTSDVGGATFDEIAKEMGFASAIGAKGMVKKLLKKMKFLMTRSEEEREEIVAEALLDYIKMLEKSGALTKDDIVLLRSHPEMVQELEGFREFLSKYIKRAARAAKFDLGYYDKPGDKSGDDE